MNPLFKYWNSGLRNDTAEIYIFPVLISPRASQQLANVKCKDITNLIKQ